MSVKTMARFVVRTRLVYRPAPHATTGARHPHAHGGGADGLPVHNGRVRARPLLLSLVCLAGLCGAVSIARTLASEGGFSLRHAHMNRWDDRYRGLAAALPAGVTRVGFHCDNAEALAQRRLQAQYSLAPVVLTLPGEPARYTVADLFDRGALEPFARSRGLSVVWVSADGLQALLERP